MGSDAIRYSDLLGHNVRADPWTAQGRSSYQLAHEALTAGRVDDARALARLTVQEAQEAYDLYALWLVELPALLDALGVEAAALTPARGRADMVLKDLVCGWRRYLALIDEVGEHAVSGDLEFAGAALERARATWLAAHDPATDHLTELLALGAEHLGESVVGSLWDALLGHYYTGIRHKYAAERQPWQRSVERLLLDIFEATRGHLCGPGRDGTFDVREEDDRWVVQFAPCGSGGRTYPTSEPTGSQDTRRFTTEEHDWAWRTKGVCLYCAHCCQLQQRAPIVHLGFPLRVVEPPTFGDAHTPGRSSCTWSIYKHPELLPANAFTDVGMPVPSWLPAGQAHTVKQPRSHVMDGVLAPHRTRG
ncbi:hypothetical protein [Dactylosporangium sp. CA-233914]|uniref:hypothetical protein n=1 Tax=Dactylosporangium sp. CA-233914 TaxID=3239934 RepID=UPI003D8EFA80